MADSVMSGFRSRQDELRLVTNWMYIAMQKSLDRDHGNIALIENIVLVNTQMLSEVIVTTETLVTIRVWACMG